MKKAFVNEIIRALYPDLDKNDDRDFSEYDSEKWNKKELKEIENIIKESLSTPVKERSTAVFHFV